MLLQDQGYKHLFWAILSYLNDAPDGLLDEDSRHWPDATISVHPSIMIGQTGCSRAAAAPKIPLEPFTKKPTPAFARVDAGDGVFWFGQPMLGATVVTAAGTTYEVVYFKWLDFELVGIERTKLPLPSTFPLHQWAMTYMGEPPHASQAWYAEESYGIVSASSVMNWEPIVPIGTRAWRPTARFCAANERENPAGSSAAAVGKRAKRKRNDGEREPKGVGKPLFANNVHVWSFGSA